MAPLKITFLSYGYIFFGISSIVLGFSLEGRNSIKTVVTIGEVTREFDENTSCEVVRWASKLENSCKCCLIKQAPALLDKKIGATTIVDICLHKQLCSDVIINQLLRDHRLSSTSSSREHSLGELIKHIYNQSVVIKEVQPGGTIFDKQGFFKESSVPVFLELAVQEEVLNNPDFRSASCITARNIMDEKGFQTTQLFLVEAKCSGQVKEYILKEVASGTAEINRLTLSNLFPELSPYIYPKKKSGYPIFILPSAYMSYRYNNKDHYLALLPKASGIKVSSYISLYKNNQIARAAIEKAYYEIGKALSLFHKQFMKKYASQGDSKKILNPTIIQGDAHQANIFFDAATNEVIFIDNERIKDRSPGKPTEEIQYFFFTTYTMFTPENLKNDKEFMNNWVQLTMESFLKGYVSVYPAAQKKPVAQEIYESMKKDHHYSQYEKAITQAFKSLNIL